MRTQRRHAITDTPDASEYNTSEAPDIEEILNEDHAIAESLAERAETPDDTWH